MLRSMLKSKIQEAKVSSTELHYAGSLGIDRNLMEAADIQCGEEIHVLNLANGARIITYAIPAPKGSGTISVKGAAARLFVEGDGVLVLSFADYTEEELETYSHRIIFVDEHNALLRVEDRTDEDY